MKKKISSETHILK